MKEEKSIERRGGSRPGAGRKGLWSEKTETIAIRIPPSVREALFSQAKREGRTLGRLLESMLQERAARQATADSPASEKS